MGASHAKGMDQTLDLLGQLTSTQPRSKTPKKPKKAKTPKKKKDKGGKEKAAKPPTSSSYGGSNYWAKGTGYGHGSSSASKWNINEYLTTQAEKDRALEQILEKIQTKIAKSNTKVGYEELEESCLVPVLDSYLRNDSLLDMDRHNSLYTHIFSICRGLASHDQLAPLLGALPNQTTPLIDLLKKQHTQASVFIKRAPADANEPVITLAKTMISAYEEGNTALQKSAVKAHEPSTAATGTAEKSPEATTSETATEKPGTSTTGEPETATTSTTTTEPATKTEPASAEGETSTAASTTTETASASAPTSTTDSAAAEASSTTASAAATSVSSPPASSPTGESSEKFYVTEMTPLTFEAVTMDLSSHHFYNSSSSVTASKQKVMRLAQEQGIFATALPLDWQSSVFVRADENNMDFLRALITGPMAADYGSTSTPYAGGCFMFDIFIPHNYPDSPPQVNLQTTGNGAVRFNPNLYNCGKVCLSLLGTWSGAEGETWNRSTSTLLQVFVSVQSLIFVPMPYFNEPGYESQIGSSSGDSQNRSYNEVIRMGTLDHAIIGQLQNPSPGFEEVIRKHFYLLQHRIVEQVNRWIAEDEKFGSTSHAAKLRERLATAKTLFAGLKYSFPPLKA
ncbi:ubiquitin-conjugating enzyme family protein [Pelomyxa schiedti]|nr:ubiquitin-conjugating enzyme family protein [Pelomyxa schiedti]